MSTGTSLKVALRSLTLGLTVLAASILPCQAHAQDAPGIGTVTFSAMPNKESAGLGPHAWVRIKGIFHGQRIDTVYDFRSKERGIFDLLVLHLGQSEGVAWPPVSSADPGNTEYRKLANLTLDVPINDAQYDNIIKTVGENWQTGPQVYNVVMRNCTTFDAAVASVVGLTLPTGFVPHPMQWLALLQGLNPQYMHKAGLPLNYSGVLAEIRKETSQNEAIAQRANPDKTFNSQIPDYLKDAFGAYLASANSQAAAIENSRTAEFQRINIQNRKIDAGIASQYQYEAAQADAFAQSLGVASGTAGGGYVPPAAGAAGAPGNLPPCEAYSCLFHEMSYPLNAPSIQARRKQANPLFRLISEQSTPEALPPVKLTLIPAKELALRKALGISLPMLANPRTRLTVEGDDAVATRSALVVVNAGPRKEGTSFSVALNDAFTESGYAITNSGDLPLKLTSGADAGAHGQPTWVSIAPGATLKIGSKLAKIEFDGTVAARGKEGSSIFEVSSGPSLLQVVMLTYESFKVDKVPLSLSEQFLSGIGKEWSGAYELCSGQAPYGYLLDSNSVAIRTQSSSWTKDAILSSSPAAGVCARYQFQGSEGNWCCRRDKPVTGTGSLSVNFVLNREKPAIIAEDIQIYDKNQAKRFGYFLACIALRAQLGDTSSESKEVCASPQDFVIM